jgi:hypothetical protein
MKIYWSHAMTRRLVLTFLEKGKPFTFEEMYEKGPDDLILYEVVSDYVKKGLINGPDPMDPDVLGGHDDWTYTASARSHSRIFVEWTDGSFVNSEDPNFQSVLVRNTYKYGPPTTVEYRDKYERPTLSQTTDNNEDK